METKDEITEAHQILMGCPGHANSTLQLFAGFYYIISELVFLLWQQADINTLKLRLLFCLTNMPEADVLSSIIIDCKSILPIKQILKPPGF